MRGIGLFNMAYGTTGLISSLKLGRPDGSAISLGVILVGGLAYLGLSGIAWRHVRTAALRFAGRTC